MRKKINLSFFCCFLNIKKYKFVYFNDLFNSEYKYLIPLFIPLNIIPGNVLEPPDITPTTPHVGKTTINN